MKRLMSAVVLGSLVLAGGASAKPSLRDVKEIYEPLYWALVAFEIADVCDSLDGRKLKGATDGWALVRKARQLGYTNEEIQSFLDSDDEKARMRARGEAYFKHKGASYDNPETFCALGRAEIERNSQIGVYLRAK
ncbi:DUF5333 domain-containing protein [Shimia sp. R9_1]|uniref:DUF5333 domain-containing protein n=1 Tax=unclassified Shimia TaxID=2630038 RepID=UPI001AD962B2|nr:MULTISPECIES: DUF5333 domain-containing protein [unclassified Shimia]MBO9402762.1 DUF5333 domain-containing protein [Shimia sp. R9_3]MBO9409516.1 DUF5333 domain-containing protein [Shimia sp. R9_1]